MPGARKAHFIMNGSGWTMWTIRRHWYRRQASTLIWTPNLTCSWIGNENASKLCHSRNTKQLSLGLPNFSSTHHVQQAKCFMARSHHTNLQTQKACSDWEHPSSSIEPIFVMRFPKRLSSPIHSWQGTFDVSCFIIGHSSPTYSNWLNASELFHFLTVVACSYLCCTL